MITPSETREGEQWLSNFAPPDRPTAALLLDSVRIVSENRFRAALTAKLIEVAQNKSIWPVAIYPVHAISTGKQETEACPNAASLTEATLESAVHRGAGDAAPAESNAGLRGKVFPFVPQISFSDAGSALVCSNIIAEVVKTLDSPDVLGPVVVESLRATRVRTVLFVSDYLGSGQEAMRYLRAWWREPTVKSWYSGFAFRAELVTYGLATRAGRRLAKAPPLLRPDIHWIESGLDFESAAWTVDEHQKILALCRQYAAHPSEALGRSKSRGLFAMGHTLPNNLPAILRQDTGPGAGGWRPFVPIGYRRLSPVQQVELADYGPRLSFASQLRSIGADDLVVGLSKRRVSEIESDLITMLAAVARGRRRSDELAEALSRSSLHAASTLDAAITLGLLTLSASSMTVHLTDAGRSVLRRLRNHGRRLPPNLTPRTDLYYPLQLR